LYCGWGDGAIGFKNPDVMIPSDTLAINPEHYPSIPNIVFNLQTGDGGKISDISGDQNAAICPETLRRMGFT